MIALAVTLSILILISLLRFGVIVEYSENGFALWAKAGFIKRRLLDKEKEKKPKKKKKDKKSNINIMPGSLSDFTDMLKAVLNTLGRFKRRLLIKELKLYYVSAGEDPANTAIQFGAANAVFETLVPGIKRNFRIRRLDLRAGFDFIATEQKIYAKIVLSIAVWEVVYVLFALMPIITSAFKKMPKKEIKDNTENDRKDGQKNGETADQRTDGHNDAKNEGND